MLKYVVPLIIFNFSRKKFIKLKLIQEAYLGLLKNLNVVCVWQYMSNRENGSGWREILQSALHELTGLLQEEGLVSSYEIHSSGLVQALLSVVSTSPWDQASTPTKTNKLQKQRVAVFKNCFKVCIIKPSYKLL